MQNPKPRNPGKKKPDKTFGVALLSAGAAAIGLGAAALAAILVRRRDAKPAAGHPVPDLAADAPAPTAEARAPDHFRPDPTAVPTDAEKESLRPATGPAPSLAADRGSLTADPQDAA